MNKSEKIKSSVRSFREYLKDPDSHTRVREGSKVYTTDATIKLSQFICTPYPYRTMVEDMEKYFESNPDKLPIMSDDNASKRRIRFCDKDKERSWEIPIGCLKKSIPFMSCEDSELLRTLPGRKRLAGILTSRFRDLTENNE